MRYRWGRDLFTRRPFAGEADQKSRSLDEPIPKAAPTVGFRVRPLHGSDEVAAYVAAHRAAFHSTAMIVEWRRRILARTDYQSDLDLIVEAPDGRIAAFAVGWLESHGPGSLAGQFEPVGTHPDFRRQDLPKALMVENHHRMRARGARMALVESNLTRDPVRQLYESVGFRVAHDVWMYAREF